VEREVIVSLDLNLDLPGFLTRNKYGEIRLAGHRIGLLHIIDRFNEGYSAEGILCEYPTLTLALVYKVIAFYLENQDLVDPYIAACRAEIERQAAAPSPGPNVAELRRRREAMRRARNETASWRQQRLE
jgi:uncharacterized protein (DUF433 family)